MQISKEVLQRVINTHRGHRELENLMKFIMFNSQAVQWYFCTTEGVFRLLSEEDILKLSIHPPYPHLKFHGGSFRATFEYRGGRESGTAGGLWLDHFWEIIRWTSRLSKMTKSWSENTKMDSVFSSESIRKIFCDNWTGKDRFPAVYFRNKMGTGKRFWKSFRNKSGTGTLKTVPFRTLVLASNSTRRLSDF